MTENNTFVLKFGYQPNRTNIKEAISLARSYNTICRLEWNIKGDVEIYRIEVTPTTSIDGIMNYLNKIVYNK